MTHRHDEDRAAIRAVIATWMEATAKGDLQRVLPLMAEDVVYLTPGNPPMRGRDAFAAGFRNVTQDMRIEATSDIQEIEIGGDFAYCWNHLKVTMTPRAGGERIHRSGQVLSVFRRNADGSWVIARDANMLTVER